MLRFSQGRKPKELLGAIRVYREGLRRYEDSYWLQYRNARILLFLKEQMWGQAAESVDAGPQEKKWDRLLLGDKDGNRPKRF